MARNIAEARARERAAGNSAVFSRHRHSQVQFCPQGIPPRHPIVLVPESDARDFDPLGPRQFRPLRVPQSVW